MTRNELTDRIWAFIEPSIEGYSKLIQQLMDRCEVEGLREVADIYDPPYEDD